MSTRWRRFRAAPGVTAGVLIVAGSLTATRPAAAQALDFTQGGPIEVTAVDGIEWRQGEQVVIARGQARAVRQGVTVLADELVAHYRKKQDPNGPAGVRAAAGSKPGSDAASQTIPAAAETAAGASPPAAGDLDTGGNEIYRLEAIGHVQIYTATDHAEGDRAVYDIDKAVLVLTGQHLRLTTPQQLLTARDSLEYYPQQHMAVGRGNAVVVTRDGRRLAADTLVGYTEDKPSGAQKPASGAQAAAVPSVAAGTVAPGEDPLAASGKLKKVDAFGNVEVRTATDIVRGDKAVYVPDTGLARVFGHVRITRGQNQLNGAEADVNLRTNISTLLAGSKGRVEGLVVPNDAQRAANAPGGPAPGGPTPGGNASATPPPAAVRPTP